MSAGKKRGWSHLGAGTVGALIGISGVFMAGFGLSSMGEAEQPMDQQQMMQMMSKFQEHTPAKGYLAARRGLDEPQELLGGAVNVTVTQEGGGVLVGLPDKRKIDPAVFGTPEMPRRFGGTPGITGLPMPMREQEGGDYTNMMNNSPFGDKFMQLGNADLSIRVTDATATDAAKTEDKIQFRAKWEDRSGNIYEVRCNQPIPMGLEFPTFGGVMTNHILHGFTGLGTPLMPTEYSYMAFWGMGTVFKNGQQIDGPRLVHGMLTEYVRAEGYKLAHDHEVTPQRRHFHLMVSPFKPNMQTGHFERKPVKTGFELPNGMELPFWHVMFENLDINATRG